VSRILTRPPAESDNERMAGVGSLTVPASVPCLPERGVGGFNEDPTDHSDCHG
jgi:hypothetical protein